MTSSSSPVRCDFSEPDRVAAWLHALEARHTANLRFAEVTRALRALSMAYVEKRRGGRPHAALDSAGKRAAFALFYAPLHLVAATCVIQTLGAHDPAPHQILDVGCGTGVAGAAWALACQPPAKVTGLDRHRWAVDEARWTYSQLGLRASARIGDLTSWTRVSGADAVVAAYVLNELEESVRRRVEDTLAEVSARGTRVLILEPVSRQIAPWWDDMVTRLSPAGFRADEWRFAIERPTIVSRLDDASGLDHRTISLRSVYHP